MTCIIAHRDGWMVSDRRITANNCIERYAIDKIQRHRKLPILVGTAGCMNTVQRVRDLLDESLHEHESTIIRRLGELRQANDGKNDGTFIVLTPTRLIEIDTGGGIFEFLGRLGVVGCAVQATMSWFNGYLRGGNPYAGNSITTKTACSTIEFLSGVYTGIGDGTQVELL